MKVSRCREAMPLSSSLQLISTDGHSLLCHLLDYQHEPAPSSLQLHHGFEAVLSCLDTLSLKEINLPRSE